MNQSTISQYITDYIIVPHHFSAQSVAVIVACLLIILSFELWMLVDILAVRKVPKSQKVAWVVGMFLIHPIVALVYFVVRGRYRSIG